MINPNTMDALGWLRKHLDEDGGSDMVREMVAAFAQQLGFPRFLGGMLFEEGELCQRHEEGSIRSSALVR